MTPGGILIVLGLPGTGKSFFAKRLAKDLGATYISSDVVRSEILDQPTYAANEKDLVYKEMIHRAMEAVVHGWVVLDGTFHKEKWRLWVKRATNVAPVCIKINASESLVKSRLSTVREDSDADYIVYKLLKGEFDPVKEDVLILESTNDNLHELLAQARSYINARLCDQTISISL